jgi:hypothetical protein
MDFPSDSRDLKRYRRAGRYWAPKLSVKSDVMFVFRTHARDPGRPRRVPDTCEQRCWFHKIANVLNALPKSAQPGAKAALAEIWNAEDREHAEQAVRTFVADCATKWPKAAAKITDDLDVLLAFYDYPAEDWIHLRTTNPIVISSPLGRVLDVCHAVFGVREEHVRDDHPLLEGRHAQAGAGVHLSAHRHRLRLPVLHRPLRVRDRGRRRGVVETFGTTREELAKRLDTSLR